MSLSESDHFDDHAEHFFPQPAVWSVTDLTREIREILEGEENLQDIWVSGEISNLSRPSSGHVYFTLKEPQAALRCVMWKANAARFANLPRDGEAVEVHGSVGVYEQGGQYQFYADRIRATGEGDLFREFLRIKDRLEEEGCFSADRKRALPAHPKRIALITSPSGAAIRDILQTIAGRDPLVEIVLLPVPVQGAEAPARIIQALQMTGQMPPEMRPDLVILARGGGSIEDLWAFNDENLAREMLACPFPLVTGIGHETDFTIADFAADLRAPTPTGAAVAATPDMAHIAHEQTALGERLQQCIFSLLEERRALLDRTILDLRRVSPEREIRVQRQRLDDILSQVNRSGEHSILLQKTRLLGLRERLAGLDPMQILKRGYAVVEKSDGQIVRSSLQVRKDDIINVIVSDGRFSSRVTEVKS